MAYYMQKGGEGVQIACKIAYVINGKPLIVEGDNNGQRSEKLNTEAVWKEL